MKSLFNRVLLLVVAVSVILTVLVSCANKPETAEECAEEYVKAVFAYDYERALDLTAGMDYDRFVDMMVAFFKLWKINEPSDMNAIEAYYKTDDYEEIIEDAVVRVKENGKKMGRADVDVYVFEDETIVGKELFACVIEFNDEARDTFEGLIYMDKNFKLNDFIIDPDSVGMIKTIDVVSYDGDEKTLAVAEIDGEWMIFDIGYDLLAEFGELIFYEITYRPFTALGWD